MVGVFLGSLLLRVTIIFYLLFLKFLGVVFYNFLLGLCWRFLWGCRAVVVFVILLSFFVHCVVQCFCFLIVGECFVGGG